MSSITTSPGTIETSNPVRFNATYCATCSDVRIDSRSSARRCEGVRKPLRSSAVRNSIAGSLRPTSHDSNDCSGAITVTK